MKVVIAPPMLAAQQNAWLGLQEISARLPEGWCLVAGQLVHLHCWERGYAPNRPTNDVDAALDVRARPEILLEFTGTLTEIGFSTAGSNMSGLQHRWIRGDAWTAPTSWTSMSPACAVGSRGRPGTVRSASQPTRSATVTSPTWLCWPR